MAKRFNLADFVPAQTVSESDRPEIELIPWDRVRANLDNFYTVDDVDELANSIRMQGLLDPITVTPEEDGWYLLISGHRRHKAWGQLREEDPEKYARIPAIVRSFGSPAMAELALIMANSASRVLSPAEVSRQAERVERLLYDLKEQGYEFPGRMRDQVAKACQVSSTKLARLKVIRDKLIPQWKDHWNRNQLAEDTAYRLARLPEDFQFRLIRVLRKPTGDQISRLADLYEQGVRWDNEKGLKCPDGHDCRHCDSFLIHDSKCYSYSVCKGKTCCLECSYAFGYGACGSACSRAVDKKKADKEAEEKKAEASRKREATKLDKKVTASAQRLAQALDAGEPMRDDEAILGWPYITAGDVRKIARGDGEDALASFHGRSDMLAPEALDARTVRKISELSGVSADWIMGLTDEMYPAAVSKPDTAPAADWQTGDPAADGRYLCTVDMGTGSTSEQTCDWRDGAWSVYGRTLDDLFRVVCWWPLPARYSRPISDWQEEMEEVADDEN